MDLIEANEIILASFKQQWEERLWAKFLVEQPEDTTFDKYVAKNLGTQASSDSKKIISKKEAEDAAQRAAQFFEKGGS